MTKIRIHTTIILYLYLFYNDHSYANIHCVCKFVQPYLTRYANIIVINFIDAKRIVGCIIVNREQISRIFLLLISILHLLLFEFQLNFVQTSLQRLRKYPNSVL